MPFPAKVKRCTESLQSGPAFQWLSLMGRPVFVQPLRHACGGTKPLRHRCAMPPPLSRGGLGISESFPLRQRLPYKGQRRRPPPAAETGSRRWGRGQQDASDSAADAGSRNPALSAKQTERLYRAGPLFVNASFYWKGRNPPWLTTRSISISTHPQSPP